MWGGCRNTCATGGTDGSCRWAMSVPLQRRSSSSWAEAAILRRLDTRQGGGSWMRLQLSASVGKPKAYTGQLCETPTSQRLKRGNDMGHAGVVPVLMYHHVSPSPGMINVTVDHFEDQLRWLRRHGYRSLSSAQFA